MHESPDALRLAHHTEQRLYVPGQGEVDVRVRAAQRVVREYDERLELARHEITGDWVVFIKLEGGNLYPVVGVGRELPHNAEDLRAVLRKYDTRVHGDKILNDINAHNERLRKASRERALDADGQVAEALEWGFRKEGAHPHPRIFVPRDI